jgi:hypothetical protein
VHYDELDCHCQCGSMPGWMDAPPCISGSLDREREPWRLISAVIQPGLGHTG